MKKILDNICESMHLGRTVSASTSARDFLRHLFGRAGIEANVSLWFGKCKLSLHEPVANLDAIAEAAIEADAEGEEVYVGCGLRKPGLSNQKRGGKHDIVVLPGLWADIDYGESGHASKKLPPTLEDALDLLSELPDPTLVVHSGHGLHAWWLTDELIRDLPAGQRALTELQDELIAVAKVRGWHVDRTDDLARVLRVPGTTNRKGEPVSVEILDDSGPRYALSDFNVDNQGLRPLESTTSPSADTKQSAEGAREPISNEVVLERLANLQNAQQRERMSLVLAGKPFAEPGERDRMAQSLCSTLAYVAPDNDPSDLAKIFEPSLLTMASQEGALTLEDIEEKIRRAQVDARRDRNAREAQDIELLRVFAPDSITEVTIEEWAAEQGCSPEEFKKRWIIQKGRAHYVFVAGAYKSPIVTEELAVSLPRDLAGAPVALWTVNAKGDPRSKTSAEVMRDYGTVARDVVADMTIQRSRYDAPSETFFEAVCPLRKIEPKHHADIAAWLERLGGADVDLLLDWIAGVTLLEYQCCALYLSGEPGTGKTMLIHGLSRLWTTDGPTELARGLDNFNADIARCPLIFADESLPSMFGRSLTSSTLRSLVACSARTLNRKFLPSAGLRGAIRLAMAANNERLLQMGDEDMSQEDMAATAARFLHVATDKAAAEYLRSIGGRAGTDRWIDGDMIAEHALWLRDNRKIKRGERFLVEGHETSVHRALSTGGRCPEAIIEWLCAYLTNPESHVTRKGGLYVGGGHVYINALTLAENWDNYVKTVKYSAHHLGRKLSNLSYNQRRINGVRCHDVRVETLLEAAFKYGIGDIEKMQKMIDRQLKVLADGTIVDDYKVEA